MSTVLPVYTVVGIIPSVRLDDRTDCSDMLKAYCLFNVSRFEELFFFIIRLLRDSAVCR